MPDAGNKILKYSYGEKSLKAPFMIYVDLECLLEKMHSRQNNLEKSYTEKKAKHTPSGYSLLTNSSFDATENKLDSYRGKDCMKTFGKDLRDHAMKIINYEEKEMILLISEENKHYEMQKLCLILKKINTDKNDEKTLKLYHKVRYHCQRSCS